MPGICIKASAQSDDRLREELAEMIRVQMHYPWYKVDTWVDGTSRAALGRVSLGFVNNDLQPAHSANGEMTAVLCGELYDVAELTRELESVDAPLSGRSHAELLLRGYQQQGAEFLRRLNGIFVAAIWDARREQLTICNDRFGMKPFYYSHVAGSLLAACEIKALLSNPDVPRDEDSSGLAQFFTFGHLLGEETMLRAVRLLPPASLLEYDARKDRLAIQSYWQLPSSDHSPGRSEADLLTAIDDAFTAAVTRCLAGSTRLGLSLSGGLDARSVLAIVDHSRVHLKTVSMGVPGSLDHRCAAEMAALTNRDHYQYMLDSSVCDSRTYRANMLRMVHLTDGHYLDQAIVMPMLPYYRQLGIEVLLRGHAGELMHMNKAYNFSLDAAAWQICDDASLEKWLMNRLSGWMLSDVPEELLCHVSRREMHDLARATLQQAVAESAAVTPTVHRIWHLFVRRRLPRETAMSLAEFGSVVETRVPFLDARLVELLFRAPPQLKVGETIEQHILRRHRPEFLRVINANTGAPLGAGSLRQKLTLLRMKVLGKLGVPGYQPYERLGLWLRRELKPLVTEVLLSDRCLQRGMFVPDTVRRVVARHWENRANHTALLMALMICEMGQWQSVDGDPVPAPAEI